MLPLTDFITGGACRQEFPGRMPTSNTQKKNLKSVLKTLVSEGHDPLRSHYVMDIDGSKPHFNLDYSPCITRSRAGSGGHWLSWKQRKMSLREICLLQGVDLDKINNTGVTDRQLAMVAGNAVPTPMLGRVLKEVLSAAGIKLR